jgi:hypothetical protein
MTARSPRSSRAACTRRSLRNDKAAVPSAGTLPGFAPCWWSLIHGVKSTRRKPHRARPVRVCFSPAASSLGGSRLRPSGEGCKGGRSGRVLVKSGRSGRPRAVIFWLHSTSSLGSLCRRSLPDRTCDQRYPNLLAGGPEPLSLGSLLLPQGWRLFFRLSGLLSSPSTPLRIPQAPLPSPAIETVSRSARPRGRERSRLYGRRRGRG